MLEYNIVKIGELKFNRVKSMYILRSEFNEFGFQYEYIPIEKYMCIDEENFPINWLPPIG